MPDIGRPVESLRVLLDAGLLLADRCGTPDPNDVVVVMAVDEHDKGLLSTDEETGSAVTEAFGDVG